LFFVFSFGIFSCLAFNLFKRCNKDSFSSSEKLLFPAKASSISACLGIIPRAMFQPFGQLRDGVEIYGCTGGCFPGAVLKCVATDAANPDAALPYKMAVLATAHKLIRVIYALRTQRTTFFPQVNS
jgi:hypothetical protein